MLAYGGGTEVAAPAPGGSVCTFVAEMHDSSLEASRCGLRRQRRALVAGAGTISAAIVDMSSAPRPGSVTGESRPFRVDES
jgi:hypothetical protein